MSGKAIKGAAVVPSEASLPLMAKGAALLLARGIVYRMAETRTRAVQGRKSSAARRRAMELPL